MKRVTEIRGLTDLLPSGWLPPVWETNTTKPRFFNSASLHESPRPFPILTRQERCVIESFPQSSSVETVKRKQQELASFGVADLLQRPAPRRVPSPGQSTFLLHCLGLSFNQSEVRERCHMAPIDTGSGAMPPVAKGRRLLEWSLKIATATVRLHKDRFTVVMWTGWSRNSSRERW